MAWSNSKVFQAFFAEAMCKGAGTGWAGLLGNTVKAALYNNTTAPDQNVSATLSGYNASTSQWVVANELSGGSWPAGGIALANKSVNIATGGQVMFDADDTSQTSTTISSSAYGALVYDDTVTSPADIGVSYHYFGGPQGPITAGTFTIVWNASNGLWRFTF